MNLKPSLELQRGTNGKLRQRTRRILNRLRQELLDERNASGHWAGELSPSALSTATAVSAMSAVLLNASDQIEDREKLTNCVMMGIDAIASQQNADGGFGDTDRSHSNIATSYLVLAASKLAERSTEHSLSSEQIGALQDYIRREGEFDALRARYGTDKTFVVPIMTNLAIAGLVDWDQIPALPFEAAVFPQSMYRMLSMPVVSYAIPALVAIGQARHFHGRRAPFPLRWIRSASIERSMQVLGRMQPESGGYLEATPLTSFVVMSLAATGRGDHEVSRNGVSFLIASMDESGRWPIDTNLATWLTSLSMHALACDPDDDGQWCTEKLLRWHLDCQHLQRHPFTGAEPGGWGWSDLSGAVPDSDDTPAAILALTCALRWRPENRETIVSRTAAGIDWLRRLQNRDGGWPTFCRGWGKLPFDRSSNDLTAHTLRALKAAAEMETGQLSESETGAEAANVNNFPARSTQKATQFLGRNQQDDGSWLPLWFGNQDREDETNPIYGTARVLLAGADFIGGDAERQGCEYLISVQNEDGGWGGGPSVHRWLEANFPESSQRRLPAARADSNLSGDAEVSVISSMEETALAVDALSTVLLSRRNQSEGLGVQSGIGSSNPGEGIAISGENSDNLGAIGAPSSGGGNDGLTVAIIRGVEFLLDGVDTNRHRVAWPIGFYFAKLWYHERLYPMIFSVTALGKYLRATADKVDSDWPR